MKNKTVAGLLALVAGYVGIHRFYLGQTGLGFLYIGLLVFAMITSLWFIAFIGVIDALALFSMDQKKFHEKYNTGQQERWAARKDRVKNSQDHYGSSPSLNRTKTPKDNMHLNRGKEKFKDYEYEEAILEFNKALKQDPRNIAAHFNLACAHSLMEHKDKGFYHLDRAVALGFDDTEVIKTRDHLAYLRIQPEFLPFEANGFRLASQLDSPKENLLDSPLAAAPSADQSELLEQLQKLGRLKEKGLLTEAEFRKQKEKLLG
jgi:TM2 domain-containing membrane protein YozV